jgi:hypothetical protein
LNHCPTPKAHFCYLVAMIQRTMPNSVRQPAEPKRDNPAFC